MKKLVFGLIATVMFGFSGNAQGLRAEFLNGKSHKEAVAAYNKLSEESQIDLWIEKTDQLLSLKLPQTHLDLLKNIKEGFETRNSKILIGSSAKLASITPLADFSSMFEKLEDYEYKGSFTDTKKIPAFLIEDITKANIFSPENSESKRACTCHWCGGGSSGSNCTPTASGCGWLWNQPCDHCMICY